MHTISHDFIVDALGDHMVRWEGESQEFSGLAIDSRRVMDKNLFIALSGSKQDGHHYIQKACEQGARGVLCRSDWSGVRCQGVTVYRVPDPFAALRSLAEAWRAQLRCPVLAVAGSVGKTTTKEMTAALLRGGLDKVIATQGSENGFLGIPLTIMRAPLDCQALVVEIGIDAPGAMAKHLEMVRPTAGVVTAIDLEHLEQLHDIETIATEESFCLRWIAMHGGTAAINSDDPHLQGLKQELRGGNHLSYGITSPRLSLDLAGVAVATDATHSLIISGLGLADLRLAVPLPGIHNARNLLAAVLLARHLGLGATEMMRGLSTFSPPEGRSLFRTLAKGTKVLCDFYNASPASMRAAFATVAPLAQKPEARLIAILGDMLDLGPSEEELHRQLATPLIAHQFHLVVGVGQRMTWLGAELKERGFAGETQLHSDPDTAARWLAPRLKKDDIVLIKGSRGMAMERTFHHLQRMDA